MLISGFVFVDVCFVLWFLFPVWIFREYDSFILSTFLVCLAGVGDWIIVMSWGKVEGGGHCAVLGMGLERKEKHRFLSYRARDETGAKSRGLGVKVVGDV